jgi:hypothetical protein
MKQSKKLVGVPLLFGGLVVFAVAGCSGNPSNCLSDAAINQLIASNGYTQCSTDTTPCAPNSEVGVLEDTFQTFPLCGAQGPTSGTNSCGALDVNNCNVYVNVTLRFKNFTCQDRPDHTWTASCLGDYGFVVTSSSCNLGYSLCHATYPEGGE